MKASPAPFAMIFATLSAFAPLALGSDVDFNSLASPFPSTVAGLDIPNAHLVGRNQGEVLRGMMPRNNRTDKINELFSRGVTDVVIFKDELNGDVTRETQELIDQYGYPAENIHAIPFRWRDVTSYREACEQMIDALKVLENAYNTAGRVAYFHCTVGEDRTGMLAGMFRMVEMHKQGWTTRKAFDQEMCMHGYEAGNPRKPDGVVQTIRQELTPIFLKLATLVDIGAISAGHLDRSVCARDIQARYRTSDFSCKASPLYSESAEP